MKIFFALIMMLMLVPNSFARSFCPVRIPTTTSGGLDSLEKSMAAVECQATKDEYQCSKLEMELDVSERYKVIQCDSKSLAANTVGNMSIVGCVWNGLQMSGEQLLDLLALPGQIAGAIAKGFNDTQMCNKSIEKKREMLNAFNLTIEDERFKLNEHFVGRWLEEAPCSEIEKLLSNRYQNYQRVMLKDREIAILTGKKPAPIKSSGKEGLGLLAMLKTAMKEANTKYECYTPKVKAEMVCAGVTALLTDVAMGGGIGMAVKKIGAVVKSKKALDRIERTVAAGEKVNLDDAATLLKGDRIKGAQLVLKRQLSEAEKKAVLEAHEIGLKEGRGFYTYTQEDLLKKARLLRETGLDANQTRALMENGITGAFDDPFMKKAVLSHFQKMFTVAMTATQQEALIAIHNLGRSSVAGVLEKSKALLKEAKFSDEQIAKILKSKSNQENGIKDAVATVADKKPPVVVETPKPAVPATQPVAVVVDSPGRKAVLANFKDDPVINYKFIEVPKDAAKEVIEAKMKARRVDAQNMLKKLEAKPNGFDVQGDILSSGESVRKSKKSIAEAEEAMAKLPSKGADLRRKELQDKIDRSKTSQEMYQKRCKATIELYREAYGIAQFMKQYETDYERNCL